MKGMLQIIMMRDIIIMKTLLKVLMTTIRQNGYK